MEYTFGPRLGAGATEFRLWAPGAKKIELLLQGRAPLPMEKGSDGFHRVSAEGAGPGTRYRFRCGKREFPDPASRQQDGDTAGWSIVRAALAPSGRTAAVAPWHESICCEVHIGTVTPEGTFNALRQRLEHFRDAGYTALEILPVNDFPGSRNWGYDGTLIFAPDEAYGTPEEFRALIDRAHELGFCIKLDVVYNHFGSTDNFIPEYAPEWFDDKVRTPWGPGIDFDQPMVREFYYDNARMWLSEYDVDGLRFDAIHEMKSESSERFLTELSQVCRGVKQDALLVVENPENIASWLERGPDGEPKYYTAQWNDDIHHVLNYLVTGEPKNGYDEPGKDPIADLAKALAEGFIHDGEADGDSDGNTHGEPASVLPPDAFVLFSQNHDQIGNRPDALRLPSRISADRLDFLHFVAFLAPHSPLFFMGEEAHVRSRFPFFFDLPEDIAKEKEKDRYRQMREIFKEDVKEGELPDPNDPATFAEAKLDWSEFDLPRGIEALARFRELARWRRELVWPLAATPSHHAISVRRGNAIIVTWFFAAGALTLAVNPTNAALDFECVITGMPVSTGEWHQHGEVLRLGPWSAVAWSSR
jgi:malto-oligosyltrehalose trehalohydrolase